MHLSKKGEYAIRALIEFGLVAQESSGALLQMATIANRTHIPEKFLEQILLLLKNQGILKSKRGMDGGYCLNRPLNSILLGEIVRMVDGPLAPIPCVNQAAFHSLCTCPDPETCGLRLAMQKVHDAMAKILDSYSLEKLVSEVQGKLQGRCRILQFEI